jgi:flavin reductase (DIM6/NTAB) family NADH-FMN oxidoreductase RutF
MFASDHMSAGALSYTRPRRRFHSKNRSVHSGSCQYDPRMHRTIEPTILYFGTPVALISTLNEDGSVNLAPMSSAWWLGWSCMLGLGSMGKTSDNLIRTGECVINLPSQGQVSHVDRLAMTTGKNPVPQKKVSWGYRYEPDKLGIADFTATPSLAVKPPRVTECPVPMEGIVHNWGVREKRLGKRIRGPHREAACRRDVARG